MKKRHHTPREELRFVRESIVLEYLKDNPYVVQEMGHCNVPTFDPDFGYTAMSKYYPYNFHEYMISRYFRSIILMEICL
eukprot:UN33739